MRQIRKIIQKAIRVRINNLTKILLLAMLAVIIIWLHTLPYFSFLITPTLGFVSYWLIVAIVFKLKSKASVIASITGLFLIGITTILLREDIARISADFAYYVIIIAFIQHLLEQRHAKR